MKTEPNYNSILDQKINHYGETKAAYQFAAEEYARQCVEFKLIESSQLGEVPTKEIETLRMQLVACGVCAQSNTEKSKVANRIDNDNIYWSASYEDVCKAVDREIELIKENKALKNRIGILERFIPKSENNVVLDSGVKVGK